eukprot:1330034-Pyramimonas_sp.AAC.1
MAKKSWGWDRQNTWDNSQKNRNDSSDYTSCATWGCKGWVHDTIWRPGLQCRQCKATFRKPQSIKKAEYEDGKGQTKAHQRGGHDAEKKELSKALVMIAEKIGTMKLDG